MSAPVGLRCPRCGGELTDSRPDVLVCSVRSETFARAHGIVDLRLRPDPSLEPAPLRASEFEAALRARDSGLPYQAALEALLRSLSIEDSDRLMQILGEARGGWHALLSSTGGDLLFLGNALSGTIPALATGGFRVAVLDLSPERARFGAWRNEDHGHSSARTYLAGDAPELPFADRSFDVVVQESGFPRSTPTFAHPLDECRRVCRGEMALVGNNRFGYKRATGRRSIHYVPGPIEYVHGAVAPKEGERTLAGHRRALAAPGFERARAFALYPHATDFTHVVAIDAPLPTLTIGPKEKRNRLKIAARAVGLFSVLAPSFLLLSRRQGPDTPPAGSRRRIDSVLAELAEKIGEPVPEVEHLVGTRGQSGIVQTRPRRDAEGGGRGRWTLHLPYSPSNVIKARRRHEVLTSLRTRFPWLPVPQALFFGRADGILLSCERRLAGFGAGQISGDRGAVTRMLSDVSAHFARLVVRPGARFGENDFEEVVGARFDLAAAKAVVPSTLAALARMRDEARERLVGRSLPRVFYHSDLRGKHLRVGRDGAVVGYIDWGTAEDEFLPYQDLLNLVVHERKQEMAVSAGEAWRLVRDRKALRAYERDALERYCEAVGIDDETARALEAIHPVFVAAMAEKNWDYSRPLWLHRQFGL